MPTINPYLTFDGNCREAMEFYHKAFGGEINIMTHEGMPGEVPPEQIDRVMHANIHADGIVLMASDGQVGQSVESGSNFSISVNCSSDEEQDRLFGMLGEGGTVTMPLADQFWGARFGMCRDKFGIHWMFNYDKPQA